MLNMNRKRYQDLLLSSKSELEYFDENAKVESKLC